MAFDRDTDPSMPWTDWSRTHVWGSRPRRHYEIRNIERPWDWNRTLPSTANRQLSAKLSWGVVNLKLKNTKPWSKHLFFVLTVQWSGKCGNKTEVSVDVCTHTYMCTYMGQEVRGRHQVTSDNRVSFWSCSSWFSVRMAAGEPRQSCLFPSQCLGYRHVWDHA